jgi:NADH:ubiquinone oxidoreductase subunit C
MRELGKVYREQREAIFVEIPLSKLEPTMKAIRKHGINVISCISAHDSGRDMEVLYHFIHTGIVLNIKTRVKRPRLSLPSITGIFPNAILFEQENHEMFGMEFRGAPMLPILLAEDSPPNPLRKPDSPSPEKSTTKRPSPKASIKGGKHGKRG